MGIVVVIRWRDVARQEEDGACGRETGGGGQKHVAARGIYLETQDKGQMEAGGEG